MTTIDSRTNIDYASAIVILPTLRETEPNDDCLGMVGILHDASTLPTVSEALRAAGYEVSVSRGHDDSDDAGVTYVWVRMALQTYTWRTDAASGAIESTDADTALQTLIAQGEWAALDSPRERADIADGAWMTIFDAEGIAIVRRGQMP